MSLPNWHDLTASKPIIAVGSAVAGYLVTKIVDGYRSRIKYINYSVSHERIGLTTNDKHFGAIRVLWHDSELSNLFISTVTLENISSVDYLNVAIKIYTGDTLLLTERSEMVGSSYPLHFTDDFEVRIAVPEGSVATKEQWNLFRHQREYHLPVLNRGQEVVFRYLTTVPDGTSAPAVFADTLHAGVKLAYRPPSPEIHGVPVKIALPWGLSACLVTLFLVSELFSKPWSAALVAMSVGLVAQSVGAILFKALRGLKVAVLQ